MVHPYPCLAGGISELRRIAAIPSFSIQEHAHLGQGMVEEPFAIRVGHIKISEEPGLRIEIDEKRQRFLTRKDWMTPHLWR